MNLIREREREREMVLERESDRDVFENEKAGEDKFFCISSIVTRRRNESELSPASLPILKSVFLL